VLLLVAVADVVAGPTVGLLALFSLAPAFACVAGTARRAVLVGVMACVLCACDAGYDGLSGTRREAAALVAVVGATGAAMLAATVRRRMERELAEARLIAETVQRVLLRPVPAVSGAVRVAVSYTSAAAAAHIGGDLYEVVRAPHATRVIVADAQGKGLEAVETAALVLGAFREAAPEEAKLAAVGERLERALNRRLEGEEFVTAILAEVDDQHCVTMLNYGHPAPLLLRADGSVVFAEPPVCAPPLGLAVLGPDGPAPYTITLGPGDQMLLYTDGVTEARDRRGRFYPLELRAGLLRHLDPDRALDALRRDMVAHTGGPLADDAAMLLLRHHAAGDPDS
jgi:serine phosphatase RsbU (regulator of sigma subunit)